VPRKVVTQWLNLARRGGVELAFHETLKVELRGEGLNVRGRLIDGEYPDWPRVVPAEIGRWVKVRKSALLQAAHLAGVGVDRRNRHGLLKADGTRLQVQLNSPEFEVALDVGPADETFEFGVNLGYLVNGLHRVRGADVTLNLPGDDVVPAGPIGLNGSDAEVGEVHVLMPMRWEKRASFEAPPRVDPEAASEGAA
jgi:DNA polymerase III sliding clamp (beta) subunit (PCNA family)